MKRSQTISLALVPALAALLGCDQPAQVVYDPCVPQVYQASACQYAVLHQGYYHGGVFYPHVYMHPYAVYSTGYSRYQLQNVVRAAPGRTTVVRGGFGSIGGSGAGS